MSTPPLPKQTPWLATLSVLELRRLLRRVRLSSRPPPRLPDAA
jgi:hypothetical protein